jgi:hypothetical protein
LHLRFEVEFAQVLLAEHELRTSTALLESVSRDAEATGFVALALETQMVRAKAQAEAGDLTGATKQLKLLEARERSAGQLLRARKTNSTAKVMNNAGE